MSPLDCRDIAQVLRVTDRSIRDRAARERWPYTEEPCRGGRRRLYPLEQLPADVKARVVLATLKETTDATLSGTADGRRPAAGDGVSPGRRALAGAVAGVLEPAGGSAGRALAAAGGQPRSRPRGGADLGERAGAAAAPVGLTAEPAPTRGKLSPPTDAQIEERSRQFATLCPGARDAAKRRLGAIVAVEALVKAGYSVTRAREEVSKQWAAAHETCSPITLYRWQALVENVPAHARLFWLAPAWAGRTAEAEIPEELWHYIKADWLRAEQPSVSAVYRNAQKVAKARGLTLPSEKTVARRLESLPWQVVVLKREGVDALKQRLPQVTRTRDHLMPMQAVNADGHVFDLRVTLPSGEEGRPVMCAWQDLYSGKVVAYRLAETLSSHLARLSFGDMVERYGVPADCYLDNGREFASKLLTGGTPTRYRFKIVEDDPVGLLVAMGVCIHWTTPYHGQAKPIERAFRDLCEGISKHPRAAGAYVGNSPGNKPHNYGQRVLSWAEFCSIVDEGVREHNARPGRESHTCRGRSFDQTFKDAMAHAVVKRPTDEQRRWWLLAAEGVKVRQNGHVVIEGNHYWSEETARLVGRKVICRFDPDDLKAGVHVYALDGVYLGLATVTVARFDDVEAGRAVQRLRAQQVRATRELAAATSKLDVLAAARQLPATPEPEPVPAGVTRLMPKPRTKVEPSLPLAATGTDRYVSAVEQLVLARIPRVARVSED